MASETEPFTRWVNGVFEAVMRTPLPARHLRVFMALVRLTWGWNRQRDRIGSQQLAQYTDLDPSDVRKVLRDLVRWKMITREGGGRGKTPIIGIVTDPGQWESPTQRPPQPVQGDLFPPEGAQVTPLRTPVAEDGRGDSIPGCTGPRSPAPRGSGYVRPDQTGRGHPDSKEKKDSSQRHTDVRVPDVAKAWPEIQEAFAAYGTPPPRDLTRKRRRLIEARLMEHLDRGLECLAQAVHGYWAAAAPANGNWDPKRGSTVRNVFRPENFPDYLDAYDSAIASGASPPFRTKPQPSETRSTHGAIVARREAIEGLYRKGLLERPDEAAAKAWEARGRPTHPAWWDPEGVYVPTGQETPP